MKLLGINGGGRTLALRKLLADTAANYTWMKSLSILCSVAVIFMVLLYGLIRLTVALYTMLGSAVLPKANISESLSTFRL